MKVDLDELEKMVDAKLADLKEEIASLQRKQAKLQEQRSQVESIRGMVTELLGALGQQTEGSEQSAAPGTDDGHGEHLSDDDDEVHERAYPEEDFSGSPE